MGFRILQSDRRHDGVGSYSLVRLSSHSIGWNEHARRDLEKKLKSSKAFIAVGVLGMDNAENSAILRSFFADDSSKENPLLRGIDSKDEGSGALQKDSSIFSRMPEKAANSNLALKELENMDVRIATTRTREILLQSSEWIFKGNPNHSEKAFDLDWQKSVMIIAWMISVCDALVLVLDGDREKEKIIWKRLKHARMIHQIMCLSKLPHDSFCKPGKWIVVMNKYDMRKARFELTRREILNYLESNIEQIVKVCFLGNDLKMRKEDDNSKMLHELQYNVFWTERKHGELTEIQWLKYACQLLELIHSQQRNIFKELKKLKE